MLAYARAGNVDSRYAALLAIGFAVGAYAGARLVNVGLINSTALRVCFALVLVYCAGRILFRPGGRARSALEALLLVAGFGATYALMRVLGQRLKRSPLRWGRIYRERQREALEHDHEI